MDKPKRIQRKRTKGWRMPANTVYVGRPTKWGNPFTVATWGNAEAASRFRNWLLDPESISASQMLDRVEELRGKNLACWCSLDCACHADVLLELANAND